MTHGSLQPKLHRLGRILAALEIAVTHVADGGDSVEIRRCALDSLADAVALACSISMEVALDDLWADLPHVLRVWDDVARADAQLRGDAAASDPGHAAVLEVFRASLDAIDRAVTRVDVAQVALTAHPRDRQTAAVLAVALTDLESAADQLFVRSLGLPGSTSVDAALAILTSVAARAARERRLAAARGSDGG